jgi:hypothetical protein
MTKPIDPKLAKFIADSKVKHRVYHGTTKDFNAFKPGRTWFATDPEYANIYAGPLTETHGENGRVMPLHVRATNPKIFNASSEGRGEWTKTAYSDSALKAKGHDSVLFVDDKGNVVNGYAMHPTQVKSAIGNRGTYDPNDPDITKANGGSVNPKYPSIQEMIQKLQEAGRTPIVPAPNRWFADPVKHPFQQKMIERVLAQTNQGREGFPSGSYINPQTGEPMDFDIMHDLGVAIDPNTGRPMMSGIKSDLTEIDPKYGSVTKSNLVRKGLFKHEGGDELLKNLAFLATIEKSGKGHHYGLSTHYASPAELVNTMTGKNPTLRPHSRGDIFGVGDEVGRISIQGKHHPVYEKLLVAPAGSDVQGKKLHKAKGGVAKMNKGGNLTVEEMRRAIAKASGSNPPMAEKNLTTTQDFHTSLGDEVRARTKEAQDQMNSWNYKYDKGHRVFTEDSAKKNRAPYEILERHRYGNHLMWEGKPWVSKKIIDPETGKAKRTPYEPAYRVRGEVGEMILPESAIKGQVDMAKGGVAHLAVGGQGPKNWMKGVEDVVEPLKSQGATEVDRAWFEQRREQNPEEYRRGMEAIPRTEAMNQWIDRNLTNYIKKQMATHDDPIRKLAEEGIVHVPFEHIGMRYGADRHRATHGGEQLAQSNAAKTWEDASDMALGKTTVGDVLRLGQHEGMKKHVEPWMEKADPKTELFHPTDSMQAHYLGFDHLVDILKQDLAEGRIRPDQLHKVSIEHAVRRAHEYDQERKKAMAEAQLKATEGMPVHKEYPEGYKWIELALNKELPEGHTMSPSGTYVDPQGNESIHHPNYGKLEDALKYEGDTMGHCVGGYCPDVASGKSRIFSLRDAKNEPHVTVEVKPQTVATWQNVKEKGGDPLAMQTEAKRRMGLDSPEAEKELIKNADGDKRYELNRQLEKHFADIYKEQYGDLPQSIIQIKGKGNAKPKKDYIPYVQDFVKSGNWSDVGDLENAELIPIGNGKYASQEEAKKHYEPRVKNAVDFLQNHPAFKEQHAAKEKRNKNLMNFDFDEQRKLENIYGQPMYPKSAYSAPELLHVIKNPEENISGLHDYYPSLNSWLNEAEKGMAHHGYKPKQKANGGTVHMADGGDMDQMQLEMMDKKMKQDSVGHYSSKGSVKKKDQTVKNAQRMAYPGIYGNPKDIAALAASRVATEDPALKLLFGVTRADMYQQAQGRKGMPHLGMLPGMAANPKGSMAAEGVMNKRNEQRLIDVMGEAQKHQGLVHGMEPWYYMNPLFDHMVKLLGLQKATEEYKKMNALMGMASSSSEVNTEIPRGSLAYWLQNQGRFNEFVKHGGKRSEDRPADFGETPGHLAHKTAHALPMQKFLERGEVDMNSPKVPMYIEASGVPATGFQTRTPVGDAHWSRAVGLADTRNPKTIKGKEVVPGASVSTPEMSSLGPWWQQNIASKVGLESVPAQALTWGAFSPQTGVTTPIGAPKLELIAKQIMQTANRLGVSPQTARDMVLTGKERMGKAHGGAIHMADGGQVDVQSIGVEEAPNMDVKMYFPPRPAQGSMLPVGGIQQAQQAPMQPPPPMPNQPPQQPSPAPIQAGQPPSNILQMTPQGQAMNAIKPPQMARGGKVDRDTMMFALMNRNKKVKYG